MSRALTSSLIQLLLRHSINGKISKACGSRLMRRGGKTKSYTQPKGGQALEWTLHLYIPRRMDQEKGNRPRIFNDRYQMARKRHTG